ncbi:MAG: TonB-dependent receptor plug domain-containing protein [Chthoniobacterales bacterium]
MEKPMMRYLLKKLRGSRAALGLAFALPFLGATAARGQENAPVTSSAAVDPAANANPAAGAATTERVIVTGSYIPTAETESALPVTVYTAEVLQKAGANTPVEGLRQLPSFVGNAATENDSNGGNGQAGINLRGIGQNNVLTLINGRRAFLGGTLNTSADINAIPISGIARSEVLKDGASAIYGSDAVAGVVNFVMLNGPGEAPYEGAEITLLYGNSTESDAHVRQAYIRGGVKTDKVAVAAAGEYYSRANLYSRDRSQLAGSGNLTNGDPIGLNPPGPGALGRGGINNNSQAFSGRVNVSPNVAGDPRVYPVTGDMVLTDLNTSQVTPASYRTFVLGTDPSQFNFRAFTPAIPAMEKAIWYVTGRYKIFGDTMQIYGDVLYAKTKQDNGAAPSPFSITNTANGRNIARASIFNPFGNRLANVRYRTVQELGQRRSFYDHDYWRYTAGLNGDLNFKGNSFISHFGYDTGLVYERFDQIRTDAGDAQRTPLLNSIAAGTFNPFIGQNAPIIGNAPTYVNGVATGLTAPYNNLQAVQAASYLGHSIWQERDWLYDAKVNGHLFPNLWNGGIDLALGYEHRQIAQHSIPDPVQAAGDQLGFNQAPNTKTLQKVDSVFTELNLPIVTSTMGVLFVRSLELAIAWRYEKFTDKDQYAHTTSSFENKNPNEDFGGSPRVSVRYQPIADLTLRGNWNQSFLSPTPVQLFVPVGQNFPLLFDPYVNGGVTLQPPNGVYQGGNPKLVPENTDSYSVGFVYTPKWLPGFTLTTDLYQIYTRNVILPAANAAQILLTLNILDPDAPGGGANGVTRLPDGSLDSIDAATANAGKRFVEGMDVTAVYEIPTQSFGTFTFSLGWNHFFAWKAEPLENFGAHNFLGDFSAAFPLAPGSIPFNKAFLRSEWGWKGWDFVATVNYIGDEEDDPNFIGGNNQIGGTNANPNFALHHRISDYETLDMQLSYEFRKPQMEPAAAGYAKDAKDGKNAISQVAGVENNGSFWQRMLWGTKLTVGCNNVFDRYPPTVLGAFNDNYDTSLYSIRNRYYYISLNKKF